MKKSRIASPVPHQNRPCVICRFSICSSTPRPSCWNWHCALDEESFTTMLEEDRTAICGPPYAHEPERPASRAGTTRSAASGSQECWADGARRGGGEQA